VSAAFLSPVFPEPQEAFLLAAARRETRAAGDRDALKRLAGAVARMSDRFTVAREEADGGDYFRSARDAIAYALHFGPVAHAHLAQILGELPPPAPPRAGPFRILDLGAGTGQAGFAAAAWAAASGAKVRLAARDRSRAALRLLRETFVALKPAAFPDAQVETEAGDLLSGGGGEPVHSLVVAHFVANELPRGRRGEFLARAAGALAPGGLLVLCEPYLHADPGWMRETRAALLAAGLVLRAPCPHAGACPLSDPCHAVRRLVPSRARQILSTALGRPAATETAYSFLVAERPRRGTDVPAEAAPVPARIVGSPTFAKGQTLLPLCLGDGTAGKVQILHRGLSAAQAKDLRRKERGEALFLAGTVRVGETLRGTLRS
jgi:ribosomal protein RSM22 (predicted rRNA methylase)